MGIGNWELGTGNWEFGICGIIVGFTGILKKHSLEHNDHCLSGLRGVWTEKEKPANQSGSE